MCDLEGFVLYNDFIGFCWNFDIVWISQVNDFWNFCFRFGENDRMFLKYDIILYLNYSFVI